MEDSAHNITFRGRGFAEVWSRMYFANAAWIGGSCAITDEAITVRAMGRQHVHTKAELVELRWVWFPFPYLMAISRSNGSARYSTFQILRWSRLRAALQSAGFSFTEELRYYSHRRVTDDKKRYGLQDGV
jgi:hypothetical protein